MHAITKHRNVADFLAELLVLALMVIFGTASVLWFYTQPDQAQRAIIAKATNAYTVIFTLLLAQPGIFLAFNIGTGKIGDMPLRKRLFWAIAAFIGLAQALPMIAGWHLQSFLVR